MGIFLKASKNSFLVNIEYSKSFQDDLVKLKSLPEQKRVWDGTNKYWEVAFDQYYRLVEIFDVKNIRYQTSQEKIENLLSKVIFHLHREFKNQISVTSIKHKIPASLCDDPYRIITVDQMKEIIKWCKSNRIGYFIDKRIIKLIELNKKRSNDNYQSDLFIGNLYPFQGTGASFLYETKRAILADMTGLGKCPQVLAVVCKLIENEDASRCIVFCPNTIKYQWVDEVKKFTKLKCVAIDGGKSQRDNTYLALCADKSYNIIICNYDLLIRDAEKLMSLRPEIIVCDEASAIKNRKAKRTQYINKIPARYKFALSATPMENSPSELFSICWWVDPGILGNFWEFSRSHVVKDYWGGISHYKQLDVLKRKLDGVMIRRKKEEVADQLPNIVPEVRRITLDRTTRWVYNQIEGTLINQLDGIGRELSKDGEHGDKRKAQLNALTMFGLLKQVCDDARLLETSKAEYAEELVQKFDMTKTKSNKVDEVFEVVSEVVANGEKIVIFSEYKRMLLLLYERLSELSDCVMIHGGVSPEDRNIARRKFWDDSNANIFLTTDAGKYGQNLQCASYLISVDVPWNPAVLEQRIGRIYRMGSLHQSVTVITFLTVDSVEERIMEILDDKLLLFERVIDGKSVSEIKLNPSTMKQLLGRDRFELEY